MRLASLISTHMDILRREKFEHLVQHILQESEYTVVSGTVDDIGVLAAQSGQHADILVHHRTRQQRISSQCGVAVRRHFYLGNHLNVAFPGIGHYLTNLVLRIVSLFYRRLALAGISAVGKALARTVYTTGTYLRKFGIFLDFNAPAVVIRQMEMQFIQFQHSHAVDDTQQVLLGGEEPCHVHQQSPIAETGLVGDGDCRNCPVDVGRG